MVLHIFFSVFIVETMNILPKEDIEKITNSFNVGLNLSFVKFINFEQFMTVMPLSLMVRRIIRTMKLEFQNQMRPKILEILILARERPMVDGLQSREVPYLMMVILLM